MHKNKDFNKAADVILLGDFNVNLLDYNRNTLVSKFVDCFISNNQLPITLHPTRLANRTATLLDFFAIKNIDNEFQTGIITTSLADHFPIYYSFKIEHRFEKPKIVKKRFFSEENIQKFKDKFRDINWDNEFKIKWCQQAFTAINDKVNNIFLDCFPLTETIINRACNPINPWMSKGLLTSRNTKEKLFTKSCRKPTYTNVDAYKIYNNHYKQLCRQAKINYFNNKFASAGKNMKECWETIREVIGSPKRCQNLPGYFKVGGSKIRTDSEIAEGFNNFFPT